LAKAACLSVADMLTHADVAPSTSSRELQPQWAYGYGAGWGNSGWGLYEYSGWTINANSYSVLDETQSRTQQTNTTDSETQKQVT